MISKLLNNNIDLGTFVKEASKHKVDELITHQLNILRTTYIEDSGKTADDLQRIRGTPISSSGFTLSYPKSILFLDLKRNKSGAAKSRHTPIYLRLVYGHLFGGEKNKAKNNTFSLNSLIFMKYKRIVNNIINGE